MKVIKIFFEFFIAILITGIALAGCKQEHNYTVVTTTNDDSTQSVIAGDELNMNYEVDQAVNEAIIASSISPTISGRTTGNVLYTTIPNAEIDTTNIATGLITITYFGLNAENTKGRTGEVDITFAVDSGKVIPWRAKGSVASITFIKYEVTFIKKNNTTLWINGTGTITNLSGGMLNNTGDYSLISGDSLTDKITAQLVYTANDNGQILVTWAWNFNELRSFSLADSSITMKVMGDTTVNNYTPIVDYGSTRSNQNFYTSITTPLSQSMSTSLFLLSYPLSGGKIIHGIAEPITVIYGVDQNGNAVSNGMPYGYKMLWTNSAGQANQEVVSY